MRIYASSCTMRCHVGFLTCLAFWARLTPRHVTFHNVGRTGGTHNNSSEQWFVYIPALLHSNLLLTRLVVGKAPFVMLLVLQLVILTNASRQPDPMHRTAIPSGRRGIIMASAQSCNGGEVAECGRMKKEAARPNSELDCCRGCGFACSPAMTSLCAYPCSEYIPDDGSPSPGFTCAGKWKPGCFITLCLN
jgi:hypothetical protein